MSAVLLVLQEGPRLHRLQTAAIVLGRSQGCDLSFDKKGVSRRHCEIVVRTDGIIVRDLGSTHGTYVDDSRIAGEALVQRGAVLRLGSRGPRIRIVDAQLSGRTVPHDEGAEPAGGAGGAQRRVPATVLTDGPAAAAPSAGPAHATAAATPRSGFARSVAVGAVAGAAGGILALLFGGGAFAHAVRDALGLL